MLKYIRVNTIVRTFSWKTINAFSWKKKNFTELSLCLDLVWVLHYLAAVVNKSVQIYAKLYKAVCVSMVIYKVTKVMKLKSACVILYYPAHYVYIIPEPDRISQIDRGSKKPQTTRKKI